MATKCPHSDVDVNGYCYACGAYVEGRDAGAAIAALFPELYEAVTERPAWLDAKSDGPMADALRPLREASQDEDGEDRQRSFTAPRQRDRCNARANVDRNRVSEDVYGSW